MLKIALDSLGVGRPTVSARSSTLTLPTPPIMARHSQGLAQTRSGTISRRARDVLRSLRPCNPDSVAESGALPRKNRLPARVPAATTKSLREETGSPRIAAPSAAARLAAATLDATQQILCPPSSTDPSLSQTWNGHRRQIVLVANADCFWVASARQLIEDRAFRAVVAVTSIREFSERFAYRHHLGNFGVERRDVP